MQSPPVTLTIAGSDCSSGAGIQADLKTFSYHGTHGLTAVTCVVAETPHKVVSIHPIPPAILQDQIKCLLEAYPIAAIKTGMLYSKAHIVATAELLEGTNIPIIVDPVMVATSGTSLLRDDAIDAYKTRLLPLATLITPNLPEAQVLGGTEIKTSSEMEQAAQHLAKLYNTSILLKGGHLPQNEDRLDILHHNGESDHYTSSTIDIDSTHGTGCTLSAAITANIAHGANIPDATAAAKQWVHSAIMNSFKWKNPNQKPVLSLNHLRPGTI